jgi:hypothetical protein
VTLKVHTGDFKFSQSTGFESHHLDNNPNQQPYATAAGCESPGSMEAYAVVDLTGTKWAVNDSFQINGYLPGGESRKESDQVYKLFAGGYCGWIAPSEISQDNGKVHAGGFYLQLKRAD